MAFRFFGSTPNLRGNRQRRRQQASQQRAAARLVFEPLEPRVLLSADPLNITLSGTPGQPIAHDVIVELVTQPPTQQNPTSVQMVQVIDQAHSNQLLGSAPLTNLSGVEITGGTGNTSLTVDATSFGNATVPQVSFTGGNGTNSLIVDATKETDWTITGANSGTVSGTAAISFSGVQNLAGGSTNANVFTVNPGGSVSGTLDGGPGVEGTLNFNNYSATTAVYSATGPHSGTVSLGGTVFTYADMSPINYSGTAANVTIDGTGDLTLGDAATPGQITVASLDNSMESVSFAAPTTSLTVNLTSGADSLAISTLHTGGASLTADGVGTDSITVNANALVSTRDATSDALNATSLAISGNLSLTAQTVTISSGAALYANASTGFTPGAITLEAESTGTASQAASASVTVDDAQVIGGGVGIGASSSASGTIVQQGAATLELSSDALALVEGASTVTATTGSVDVTAYNNVDGNVTANAAKGGALDTDAADALTNLNADTTAAIIGTSTITAADTVSVISTNEISVTTTADGSPQGISALGGAAAVSDVYTSSTALLGIASVTTGTSGAIGNADVHQASSTPPPDSNVQVTAGSVLVNAVANVGVSTTATATTGGATADGAEGQQALAGQVAAPNGPVNAAAAIAETHLIDSASASSAASVTTTGSFAIAANADRGVMTYADAADVDGNGLGSASALNLLTLTTTAEDTGSATVGGDMTLSVGPPTGQIGIASVSASSSSSPTATIEAEALSGPGGTDTGAAVATNDLTDTATAEVSGGQVTAAALSLTGSQTDTVKAIAAMGGVPANDPEGAVISTNNINAEVATLVDAGANIGTGTGALTLTATSANMFESEAGSVAGFGAGGLLGTDAYNDIDNTSDTAVGPVAQIDDATVTAGATTLQSENNDAITAYAVGAAGASDIAPEASLADNTVDPRADAEADADTLTLTGALTLTAMDQGTDTAGAGSTEGAGDATGGGALAVNQLTDAIQAQIDGGTVGAVSVGLTAESAALIGSTAAVGGAAGTTAASTSIAINSIGGAIDATITDDATVTGNNGVSLAASDTDPLSATSGAAATAETVDGGTAIALNRVGKVTDEADPDVTATIDSTLGNPANDPAAEPALATTDASIGDGANVSGASVSLGAGFHDGMTAGAIAGSDGGGNVGQSGSLTDNLIADQATATVTGATTQVQATGSEGDPVTISVVSNPDVNSLAGTQSGNPAGGAAAAVNKLADQANATVVSAAVSSLTGDVDLRTTGGALATASAVSGSIAGAVATSAATALNDIGNTLDAEAEDGANVDAAGNVELTTEDGGTAQATANGTETPGGVAKNGADATNDVADQASTRADNATLTASDGEIELYTTDTVSIQATGTGDAGGGLGSISATVSTNQVSNVLKAVINDTTAAAGTSVFVDVSDTGKITSTANDSSVGFGGGGSAGAFNQVQNTVAAAIEGGANVTATDGDVMVQADDDASVGTFSQGFSAGLGASGGSQSVSLIDNTVYADVASSTVAAYGNLGVLTDDTDKLTTDSGETTPGLVGGSGDSAAAVTIGSQTDAYIDSSKVSALGNTGDILVPDIVASTGAATATDASGVAVGARSVESITVNAMVSSGGLVTVPATVANIATAATTDAYITRSSVNTPTGTGSGVLVHASQATTVNGNIGATSGGLSAIGAEVQIANIGNTTEAYIADDPATDSGSAVASAVYADTIIVSTTTYENVSATTHGVAGGADAISGTVTYTDIDSSSDSYVEDSLLDARNGNAAITVEAQDDAGITTNNSNVVIGLAGVGAAVDVSTIGDTTVATLDGAQLNANGAITVDAQSTGAINDDDSGSSGGLVAIGASVLIDHINSATEASTQSDGSLPTLINQDPSFGGFVFFGLNTQSVTLQATGAATVQGQVGANTVGLVGAGAAIQVGGIDDQVSATVGTGTVINSAGDITVGALDSRNLQSTSQATTGGFIDLGGAFSILSIGGDFNSNAVAAINKGHGSNAADLTSQTNTILAQAPINEMISANDGPVATNWLDSDTPSAPKISDPLANSSNVSGTFAEVGSSTPGTGPKLTAGADITVAATNLFTINSSAGQSQIGFVSLGIGVAYTDVTDTVSAETGDGAELSAGGNILVKTVDSTPQQAQTSAYDGTGGLVGVGGALTETTLNLAINALLAPSTTVISAGGVSVLAVQNANLQTTGNNVTIGLAAGGAIVATTTIQGSVDAGVGNGDQLGANDAIGSLSITATTDDLAGTDSTADSGGAVAIVGSEATSTVDPHLSSILGNDAVANVAGNVSITTDSSGSATADASGTEVGIGAVGLSDATATFSPSGAAVIGNQAYVGAGGGVTVQATDASTGNVTATSDASSGGFGAGAGANSNATDNGSALAEVDDGATVEAGGTVSIDSAIVDNAQADTDTKAIGLIAIGGQSGTADADGTSTAELGSNTTVNAYGLEVEAAGSAIADTTAVAAAGGIASGIGANSSADASPVVTAEVVDGAQVQTVANVAVIALGVSSADAQANGTDGAAFGEIGTSQSTVTGSPSVDAAIGRDSVINAGGNITVEALTPQTPTVSNGSFNAATAVNLPENAIRFSGSTYLQTGDQVTYETNGNTPIGGLQNGRTYSVIETSGSSFSLGQQFTGAQVNAASSTIQFAGPDGFQTGDRVVYADNGGPAIGGLVNGTTYYVRVINPTTIKLATSLAEAESTGAAFTTAQIGANGVITWRGNGYSNGEAVTYRSTGGSISGLVNGDTYFVVRLNANQFELSAQPNGPALVLGQGSVSGVQTLGAEGVALDGTGVTGFQSLVYRLTSDGSGTQQFVGVGGAVALLSGAQSSTYYYGANASGSGGAAFVGVEGMTASITVNATVTAYVGVDASLKAGDDLTVQANDYRDTVVDASSEVGGLGAVGGAYGTTNDIETTTAQIADGANLGAGQDADVTASGQIAGIGESTSNGGGGVAVGQANSTLTDVPVTSVQIDQNARVSAQNDLTVNANQNVTGAIYDNAGDGGLGASSHADGTLTIGWPGPLPVAVQVGTNVALSAGNVVTISAQYALPEMRVQNTSSSGGLYAHPTTNTDIEIYTPVEVTLSSGDAVTAGTQVNLATSYGVIGLSAFPTTEKTGIGGQDPDALVEAIFVSDIVVPDGVTINTHGLSVEATVGTPHVLAEAYEGNSPQPGNDIIEVVAHREITFDATTLLNAGPSPELVINRFGQVVDHVGVKYSIAGGVITVDDISDAVPGWVRFGTDAGYSMTNPLFPPTPYPSLITGTQASITFVNSFAAVTLTNESAMSMVVNNIDPVVTLPAATVNIAVDNTSGFKFTLANAFQPTVITIGNYAANTLANLTLAGEIDDPIGTVELTAKSGNITAKNGNALVQGAAVSLNAGGNIGTSSQFLPVQVIDSANQAMALNATAGGNLDLSVQARLRDPSVSDFAPQLGSLVAGGNLDLDLLPAVQDSAALGPVYSVAVTLSLPTLGGPTTTTTLQTGWPNNVGPAPTLPPGVFAVGSTPLNATYTFALLQAGGTISVTEPAAATVGLTAKTDLVNPGNAISVAATGNVALTETSGDMLVGSIVSTGGSVTLVEDVGSILDQQTTAKSPPAAIEGSSIGLTAYHGNIGTLNDQIDIELTGDGGSLTALSRNGINILEVAGALALNSVGAGGAIILDTAAGGIAPATGAAEPTVVGQTITLNAQGGGIATPGNPLQVEATAMNGVSVTSTGQAYLDQVTDAVLLEAGLGWSLGDGGTTFGLVSWEAQV